MHCFSWLSVMMRNDTPDCSSIITDDPDALPSSTGCTNTSEVPMRCSCSSGGDDAMIRSAFSSVSAGWLLGSSRFWVMLCRAPKCRSTLAQALSDAWSRSPCQYLLLVFWLSFSKSFTIFGCCVFGAPVGLIWSFGLSLNRDQYAKLNTPKPADAYR